MIIITGAAGFIGSALVNKLNNKSFSDIVISDDFSRFDKMKNLEHKSVKHKIHRDELPQWIEQNYKDVKFVFHLGARTDTAEFDMNILNSLNLNYSKIIWKLCTKHQIPLVYASSAATYGNGELGYSDSHDIVHQLQPLNPYGVSKNEFDKFTTTQTLMPPMWAGLKFFNVYGPNEYHKSRMASVIFHAYNQIRESGKLKLFRSHNKDFEDGMQLRDFIYVKDAVQVCYFFMVNNPQSGLYNLGTGKARSFIDLGKAVFASMNKPENIEFVDIPHDIKDKYQYYTQANMKKLHDSGCNFEFYTLEEGVYDYVCNYLQTNMYY